MTQIIALSKIRHDGIAYEAGDIIPSITAPQIAQLDEAGVIKIKKDTPEKKTKRTAAKVKRDEKEDSKDSAQETPNIKPQINMSRVKLVGIGRARGLEIAKTVNRNEAFAIVNKDYKERGEIDVAEIENPEE